MSNLDRLQRHLDVLSEVGKITSASLSLDDVLAHVMGAVTRLFSPEDWSVLLVEEPHGDLRFALTLGRVAETLRDLVVRKGEGIAGWVADQAQAVLIPDTENDRRFQPRFDAISGYRTRSIVAVPMRSRNRVVGVVELCNVLEEGRFRSEDLPFLALLCDYAGVAVDNARTHAQVLDMSRRDPLTNLLNSTSFLKLLNDQIALAERDRSPLSVVFLDIDSFKQVVDTHGHLTASRVLAEIGHRIQRLLGPQQHAARFGGDEFSIVLLGASAETALAWGERLRASLRAEPYQLDLAGGIHVTASIGIATFPGDAASGEELLKAADAAMYRVKGNGKDACRSAR